MAEATTNSLVTSQSSGTQASTENPQTLTASSGDTSAQQDSVQPGTSSNLLKSSGGQALYASALPSVNLADFHQSQSATTQPASITTTPHHINTAYFVVPVVLVLLSIFLFWLADHSEKGTKQYT